MIELARLGLSGGAQIAGARNLLELASNLISVESRLWHDCQEAEAEGLVRSATDSVDQLPQTGWLADYYTATWLAESQESAVEELADVALATPSPANVERLVRVLASENVVVQKEAASALGKLTIAAEKRKIVANAPGSVEGLVRLLGSQDGGVQYKAANAMANLALNPETRRMIETMPGSFEALIRLLGNRSPNVQFEGARALANLAVDKESRKAIAAVQGSLDELVRLTDSEHLNVQEEVAMALERLASDREISSAIVAVPGSVGKLVRLLSCKTAELECSALRAFTYLGFYNGKAVAEKRETLEGLMRILSRNHIGWPPEAAASALAHLAHDIHIRHLILSVPGSLDALSKMLSSNDVEMHTSGAGAIANLAQEGEGRKAIVSTVPEVVERLVHLLGSESSSVRGAAATAVGNLAFDEESWDFVLAVRGILEALVRLLSTEDYAQEQGARALSNLAKNAQNRKAIGAVPGSLESLVRLTEDGTIAAQDQATWALYRLAMDVEVGNAIEVLRGVSKKTILS